MSLAQLESEKKRLHLRVAVKLMMWLGFAGIVYVFISAIGSGDRDIPDVPSMRIDLADIAPGSLEFHEWENRPVMVYRRLDSEIVALRSENTRLWDAASEQSRQPEPYVNSFRSATPEWFVAIALGTGQGCPVALLPASDRPFQGQPWPGGFRDSCSDDRYDFAGRVYADQYAKRNLTVPQYKIDGSNLILGQ